jgi:hypothetical protein
VAIRASSIDEHGKLEITLRLEILLQNWDNSSFQFVMIFSKNLAKLDLDYFLCPALCAVLQTFGTAGATSLIL